MQPYPPCFVSVSPGTSSRHLACSCCVLVNTADCIHAFNSTIAWLLKYHINNVLARWWRELVPGEKRSLTSSIPIWKANCNIFQEPKALTVYINLSWSTFLTSQTQLRNANGGWRVPVHVKRELMTSLILREITLNQQCIDVNSQFMLVTYAGKESY
jgi:hypothetical protein